MALMHLGRILLAAASVIAALADQRILKLPEIQPVFGQLRRFNVSDSEALNQVLTLVQGGNLDIWQVTRSHVDIYSPPSSPEIPPSLRHWPHSLTNIPLSKHMPSTKSLVESIAEWDLQSLENTTFHSAYHPLYEIDAFMHELAAMRPNLAHIHKLGHSGEGREMWVLTISKDEGSLDGVWEGGKGRQEQKKVKKRRGKHTGHGSKLGFVIFGAQHAREWVATATSLYIAHALVSNTSEHHSLTTLLDDFDFHVIPSPNPDGYDYTWESDRFWYKNRQVMGPKSKCIGLDMNRNWGYKWKPADETQSMFNHNHTNDVLKPKDHTDHCSVWYPGHRPFEAPEVNNIANYVVTLPNLVGFMDLRSYGQMLSSPYSYSCNRVPKDAENQIEAALGATRALKQIHGTPFTTGRLCSMLYRAPGNVVDWMYKRVGIKYSYVVHLRDTGTYGFALPSRWIRPVGEEMGEMVEYLAKFIAKKSKSPF